MASLKEARESGLQIKKNEYLDIQKARMIEAKVFQTRIARLENLHWVADPQDPRKAGEQLWYKARIRHTDNERGLEGWFADVQDAIDDARAVRKHRFDGVHILMTLAAVIVAVIALVHSCGSDK